MREGAALITTHAVFACCNRLIFSSDFDLLTMASKSNVKH